MTGLFEGAARLVGPTVRFGLLMGLVAAPLLSMPALSMPEGTFIEGTNRTGGGVGFVLMVSLQR